MIVKEVLLNALANAGDIHDGDATETDDFALALRLFNTEMRFYSGKNLITAYQAVLDIDKPTQEQIIGKYNVRKGMRVYEVDEKPDANKYIAGRDFIRLAGKFYKCVESPYPVTLNVTIKNMSSASSVTITSDTTWTYAKSANKYKYIVFAAETELPFTIDRGDTVTLNLYGLRDDIPKGAYLECSGEMVGSLLTTTNETISVQNIWQECDASVPCEYIPDIVCNNMERVMTVMFKNSLNQYERLRFVPLTQFYTENDDYIYSTATAGENKVKLLIPSYIVGRPLKVIYNTNMLFQKNDRLELPDNHIALVEIAVTVALLRHDADSDPTRLNNYKEQLAEIVNNIEATTVTERRIMREGYGYDDNILRSGRFITRKFNR